MKALERTKYICANTLLERMKKSVCTKIKNHSNNNDESTRRLYTQMLDLMLEFISTEIDKCPAVEVNV